MAGMTIEEAERILQGYEFSWRMSGGITHVYIGPDWMPFLSIRQAVAYIMANAPRRMP